MTITKIKSNKQLEACNVNVWLIVGILFLTVLTSVPSQRLGVQLNKSILHDFFRL